jgi:predicted Fe-Mo cluster-binding NifX family protein
MKTIAFRRCPECGCCRIIGELDNNTVKRMAYNEWQKANGAYKAAWEAMMRSIREEQAKGVAFSSVGVDWVERFRSAGYEVVIYDEYDGC